MVKALPLDEVERMGFLTMRFSYYEDAFWRYPYCEYQFEKASYQQFLREQGLSEHDIKRLNIRLITDFTCSHFKGSVDLKEGGAYFHRCREYVERDNKTTLGFYRPYDPPHKFAAIFLRPGKCHTAATLHQTFLHETRHHLQHCLKLSCCSAVNAGIEGEEDRAKNQPWEIDADEFAENYSHIPFFILPVFRPLRRSDL